MGMFQMKWLRRLIRRHTNQIPVERAFIMKERMSIVYALLAWNAFGMICYMIYTGRNDWAKYYGYKTEEEDKMPPAIRFAKQMNIEKATVLKFKGFEKQASYTIDNETEED